MSGSRSSGTVSAYLTTQGDTARLRRDAGECDRLGLFAGKQVRAGLSPVVTRPMRY